MKNFFIAVLFFTSWLLQSQSNQKIIHGIVYIDSIPTQDVHIINKKLALGTVSNENGFFEILAEENNTLLISHLNLEYKEITVSNDNIKNRYIIIHVKSKTHMLDEVVLEKRKGIFEVDKDILINNPVVDAKTLKLPYANSKPKDDKTVKIESGITVGVEGLVNALNGKNKQKKLLKKLQAEDQNLSKIRKHFTDGFFVKQLNIKEEHINLFLESCISRGIINLYNKDKVLELTSVLVENSKTSPYLLKDEKIKLTQK